MGLTDCKRIKFLFVFDHSQIKSTYNHHTKNTIKLEMFFCIKNKKVLAENEDDPLTNTKNYKTKRPRFHSLHASKFAAEASLINDSNAASFQIQFLKVAYPARYE